MDILFKKSIRSTWALNFALSSSNQFILADIICLLRPHPNIAPWSHVY